MTVLSLTSTTPGYRMTRRLPALLPAALVLLLTACTAPQGAEPGTADDPPPAQETAAGSQFPLTVTSCGTTTTLEDSPERIVTIKSSATEMVLALGAGERLVGTAFSDGPVAEGMAEPGGEVLAEDNPSWESVLELEPDLVYAGWESNLSADGAGDRERYEELGIATYVSPGACREDDEQISELTFDDVFDQVHEMGSILDETDAAESLVAEQQAELDSLTGGGGAPGEGRRAVWYSSGSDVPYVGAGQGAPQMIMAAVGLENIAADVDDTWTSLSWETVAQRDPEVVVLVDSAWNTAEHKIEVLQDNPVTAALPAVAEDRFVVVDFPATEAGVRNVPAAVELARQLREL